MRLLPATASILSGLTVYLLLEAVFGGYGFVAMHILGDFSSDVARTRLAVEERSDELRTHIQQLQTDAEAVRVAAHDLGFVGEGEGIIRIEGYRGQRSSPFDPGQPAPAPPEIADNRPLFRGIALVVALVVFLVSVVGTNSALTLYRSDRHSK